MQYLIQAKKGKKKHCYFSVDNYCKINNEIMLIVNRMQGGDGTYMGKSCNFDLEQPWGNWGFELRCTLSLSFALSSDDGRAFPHVGTLCYRT